MLCTYISSQSCKGQQTVLHPMIWSFCIIYIPRGEQTVAHPICEDLTHIVARLITYRICTHHDTTNEYWIFCHWAVDTLFSIYSRSSCMSLYILSRWIWYCICEYRMNYLWVKNTLNVGEYRIFYCEYKILCLRV